MMPKVKTPKLPKPPVGPDDVRSLVPVDNTSRAYSSLVNTTPAGLATRAKTQKKSLLGGSS